MFLHWTGRMETIETRIIKFRATADYIKFCWDGLGMSRKEAKGEKERERREKEKE